MVNPASCISFDSYIKPQLCAHVCVPGGVVYLLIPTSNHNCINEYCAVAVVVYLLIPTSNHNREVENTMYYKLYIF